MTFALVASVKAMGNGASSAIDTTGADLITLIKVSYGGSGAPTDSKGNTYTARTQQEASVGWNVRIYDCHNPIVGTGHTFTGPVANGGMFIEAWSGSHASSTFNKEGGAVDSVGGTSHAPGSITSDNADSLVIAGIALADSSTGTLTANGGFSVSQQNLGSAGVYISGGIAHLVQTSIAAANPTFSGYSSSQAAAVIAVYIPAAGGGGGSTVRRSMAATGAG